ncbi:diacylglycerol O-acyltransferase 1-like [Populus alba x Populus x berolinensis]|uniref:diacylglycerol O-acyltransferase n=1 Tax=Populus alba x Populus x berolinensis TaxID=444605 RepID=A0AAD6VZJ0_9ROSI|nr:diacylglycerol O-acyltransferase 1-like [Populus alba x Populus x berolinensis]
MHHWLYSIVSITAMYLWCHLMLIILQLCIAVPCHVFKLWAFIGIMLQVPLVVITKFLQNKFRSSMVGNMIFWLFFSILGQPMCVLLYYHDLMNRKGKTESS